MSKTVHSIKLQAYDAVDLNRVSYANGEIVYDNTNSTIRIMNGNSPGGISVATQSWVNSVAITTTTLNSVLNSALSNYVPLSTLSVYATVSALNSAIASVNTSTYSLPTASTNTLGGVKVDGTTITINNGIISGANTYVLPNAQSATGGNTLGGVIPDGTTITINPATGVITGAQLYTLPASTTSTLGGVIVPAVSSSGLTNSSGTIGLATASTTQIGGVKIDGSTVTISSGIISAPYTYTLPAATTNTLGGVIIPVTSNSGLTNSSGTIRLVQATTNQLGGVKVDGTTITISAGGQISAVFAGAITFVGAWSASANSPTLVNGSGTNGNEYICSAAGTVNFGAGNITFSVGDAVIYNGTLNQWIRIPASSALASLTFAASGGTTPGSSYNGTGAVTIDYSSIGASPTAGSASLTTVGTIGTGVWNGTIISPTYGGTGINNSSYTITLGGNISTAGSLTTSGSYAITITSTAATSVTLPTSGYIMSSVTALPGAVSGTPSSSTYLRGDGTWAAVSAGGGGTVSSVGGTGTVSGITLTGTVTTSGNLTLGGSLSLVSPPAIGSTTANTGAFTTLSASGQITSTLATGTAPFVVASTTNVVNLNASSLNGATFASPGTIGGTTPGLINATNFVTTSGNVYLQQPNPTALTATATLTIAQLLTDIITVTSTTAVTLTLPTGTLTDAGILSGTLGTNGAFDWVVINLGSSAGAITMAAGTSHTYVGSTTIPIGTSATFRTRKIATNSYTTYRIH